MQKAVIVACGRTPSGRAYKGALAKIRPDDLAAVAIQGVLARTGQLDPAEIEDVILGCATPEAEQGTNVARIALLRAGLPDTVPGMTVNRFCSSGLQTIAIAAQSIMTGMAQVILAGGTESMSMVPVVGHNPRPNPSLMLSRPETYMAMGLTAEKVAAQFGVTRLEQDNFALQSHLKALAASENGRFDSELIAVPLPAETNSPARLFTRDEGPRAGTTLEALSGLQPVFKTGGSVTAGNCSPMSDGAAMALIMSEGRAQQLGLSPLARFVSYAVTGTDPALMGIGPVTAVPKALRLAGLEAAQIDLWEVNEAFASQAVYVARALGIPAERLNVNGGAIALGHPMGATGAKLTATLLAEMVRRGARYGIVTMCIGGGMGAAAVFENLRR
ncbi:thiolase family protein [Geopsychrobacter electrodiphilus]|uniref:thiolase family protein n=1 Tax=Geopsychrobacter electrodiphilus TaxID=225196 RepID=UPI000367333C|nr:thiolase family protein [Geopsychrobacter electrodiphilus]